MAVVFAENSEHGNAPLAYGWDVITGAPAINTTTPMKGTYDIRVGRGGQNADRMLLQNAGSAWSKLGVAPTVAYSHFWFRVKDAWPTAGNHEYVSRAADNAAFTVIHYLAVEENGHLYIEGAAGTYFQLVLNQKVEVETCFALVGANFVATLWVNGTFINSYSVDHGGADLITALDFGSVLAPSAAFNYDAFYDDIVVDTARRIGTGLTLETEVPTSDDGTENEWTPNPAGATKYDKVDDIPYSTTGRVDSVDGATDATSQEQLFGCNATTATGTVIGVDVLLIGRRGLVGSVDTCWHRTKLSATGQSTACPPFAASTTYHVRFTRGTDPDSNAWTKANADALLIGGQRGANAAAYSMRIYDLYKTVVYRDPPQDWAGII